MTVTLLDILSAQHRYEAHAYSHDCADRPCPVRVKLMADYRRMLSAA